MISSPGTLPGADPSSILAADIGATSTKVALFEHSEGAWRLRGASEAVSTSRSPSEGMLGGMLTGVGTLERVLGERLTDRSGRLPIGPAAGALGALAACSSAAPPLRLIILATSAERSGLWGAVAGQWSHTDIIDCAAMDAGKAAGQGRWADAYHRNGREDVMARLQLMSPEAVLIVGGYDGGACEPVVRIARMLQDVRSAGGAPLPVVFAGNSQAAQRVAHLLAGRADVRIAANVLPAAGWPRPEPAGEALDDLYCQLKLGALRGHATLASSCAGPLLSSARALALAWQALAETLDAPVLGLDIGANTTIAGLSGADGFYRLGVHSDLGVSAGWDLPSHDIDAVKIARWMPRPVSKTEVQTRLATRRGGFAVPQAKDALLFQEALTREAWRLLLEDQAPHGLRLPAPSAKIANIVGSGGVIMHTASLWRVALLLLDAAEPHGLVRLWIDRSGALPQTGALASFNPNAARSVLFNGSLMHLGLAVCFSGATTSGSKAVDVEMRLVDGSVRRTIAAWGTIHLLPAGSGPCTIILRPVAGVNIAGHEDEESVSVTVPASEMGVILDCRGRPVTAQLDPDRVPARMHSWLVAGEHEQMTVPELDALHGLPLPDAAPAASAG